MEKKKYTKMSLREMRKDIAAKKKAKAQKEVKFKYKFKKAKLKTGSKLATLAGNKAHQIKVQSKRPGLYDSSGKAYKRRKK